jgi:rhodanese-related sulfurtransferase
LGLSSFPVLIADSEQEVTEARMRLARIGLEQTRGYLKGGVEAWSAAGLPLSSVKQINAQDVSTQLNEMQVLDVRRAPEWEGGHIDGAVWWPLDNFKVAPPEVDRETPTAVHCKSGYRSMIACSLLQRAGFENVIDVIGGFDAWLNAKLPVATEKPVSV